MTLPWVMSTQWGNMACPAYFTESSQNEREGVQSTAQEEEYCSTEMTRYFEQKQCPSAWELALFAFCSPQEREGHPEQAARALLSCVLSPF